MVFMYPAAGDPAARGERSISGDRAATAQERVAQGRDADQRRVGRRFGNHREGDLAVAVEREVACQAVASLDVGGGVAAHVVVSGEVEYLPGRRSGRPD